LLKHPFILTAKNTTGVLTDTVEKFKHVKSGDQPPKAEEGSDNEDNGPPVTPSPSTASINPAMLAVVPPEGANSISPEAFERVPAYETTGTDTTRVV